MIPLNFYRDDNYVYYNNPNGITKKMTIADFEALMSGEGGGGGVPVYSDSQTIYLIKDTEVGGFHVYKYDQTAGRYVPYPYEQLFTDLENGVVYTFYVTDDNEDNYGEIYPNEVVLMVVDGGHIIIGDHFSGYYELSEGSETVDTILKHTAINLNEQDGFISNIGTSSWDASTGTVLYSIQTNGLIEE